MSQSRVTEGGLGRRNGRIEVALSRCCANDDPAVNTYCLDVTEYPTERSRECVENDHDCSSVPLDATAAQIAAYLDRAIDTAAENYARLPNVRRMCSGVDAAAATTLTPESA